MSWILYPPGKTVSTRLTTDVPMSTPLPASIEAHLKRRALPQQSFGAQKLLEEEALTVREIAAKTAKSTGIIDQAIKKMLSRAW